jgi:hypothetical protein
MIFRINMQITTTKTTYLQQTHGHTHLSFALMVPSPIHTTTPFLGLITISIVVVASSPLYFLTALRKKSL